MYKLNLIESIKTVKNDVNILAVTLGPKGAVVFESKNEHHINPIKVEEPIDTTGAGDLFASGFLFGVINKFSIDKCGSLGNKSASEIIKYVGARPKTSLKKLLDNSF